MFKPLQKINSPPNPYEFYTAETLWNDPHISQKMLEFHLNPNVDPASRNQAFIVKSVAWMTDRFNIGTNVKIADFGCGPGLYSSAFAAKGASVTGIDFSERSIAYARNQAVLQRLDINYVQQNYLTFRTKQKFNLICLIYCDLCPLSPSQRKRLYRIFRQHLEDDGVVLLDVFSLNAFALRQEVRIFQHRLMDGFWSAADYYGFLNTFRYEAEKVVLDKYTIIEETKTWEVYNWLQYYTQPDLEKELKDNGLQIVDYYSDVAGTYFSNDSPEIAVIVKKMS